MHACTRIAVHTVTAAVTPPPQRSQSHSSSKASGSRHGARYVHASRPSWHAAPWFMICVRGGVCWSQCAAVASSCTGAALLPFQKLGSSDIMHSIVLCATSESRQSKVVGVLATSHVRLDRDRGGWKVAGDDAFVAHRGSLCVRPARIGLQTGRGGSRKAKHAQRTKCKRVSARRPTRSGPAPLATAARRPRRRGVWQSRW